MTAKHERLQFCTCNFREPYGTIRGNCNSWKQIFQRKNRVANGNSVKKYRAIAKNLTNGRKPCSSQSIQFEVYR